MPREKGEKLVASNRKARHDYHIEDTYEAGMVLSGTEVKSLRAGHASLVDGYASVENGEAWLENVHKLLLNRHEIEKLLQKIKESGYTLVPLKIYFKDGRAKVEIAVARGKKDYDKRHALKEAQDKREAARAMSTKGKDW
ncbi:MAG: hypothetical protein RL166_197 [Actinomycetota bacterium]